MTDDLEQLRRAIREVRYVYALLIEELAAAARVPRSKLLVFETGGEWGFTPDEGARLRQVIDDFLPGDRRSVG